MGREGNRFKFESFTKKIAKVGGDRALFRKELGGRKHNEETFFVEALEKWTETDRGSHFYTFLKDIPTREIGTYAQVIHHHKQILEALLHHISFPGCTCQIPLLELTIALAKDLRDEFYEYMWRFFEQIISIMEQADNNVELLEITHLTMALLFKQHWRSIVKESRKTFDRFSLLFASNKQYLRRFAAEAFAFLIRKISMIQKFTTFMIEKAHRIQDGYFSEGISMLIYNAIRGVNGQFHSATNELLGDMLAALFTIEDSSIRNTGLKIFERAIVYCLAYAKNDHFKDVSSVLMKTFELRNDHTTFCESLRLIVASTETVKKLVLFSHRDLLLDLLQKVIHKPWFKLDQEFFDLLATIINRLYDNDKWKLKVKALFDDLSTLDNFNDSSMISFLDALSHLSYFDSCIMPSVGTISGQIIESSNQQLLPGLLKFYAKLCVDRRPIDDALRRCTHSTFFDASLHEKMHTFVEKKISNLPNQIAKLGEDSVVMEEVAQLFIVWTSLTSAKDQFSCQESVLKFLRSLITDKVPSDPEFFLSRAQLVLITASALYQVDSSLLKTIDETDVLAFVKNFLTTESAIRFYHLFVTARGISESLESLDEAVQLLSTSFTSPCHSIRRCALQICASFNVPLEDIPLDDNGVPLFKKPANNMFAILASAESESPTTANIRDRLRQFRSLLYGGHLYTIPKGRRNVFETIILKVSLAQFYHQFTPIWSGIHEILISHAKGLPIDVFWAVIEAMLNDSLSSLRNNKPLFTKTSLESLIPNVDAEMRTDFSAVIDQLCKFLQKVPEIAERRTKTLSPIFLEFFNKDYMLSEKPRLATQKEIMSLTTTIENTEQDDVQMDVADEEVDNAEQTNRSLQEKQVDEDELHTLTKKMARKILIGFLELFSSFRSPKMIFRQPEVYGVYNELLLSWDADLQKAALKCLFAYKYKWLVPYKDNLNALLDKKTFRTELVNFNIGSENSVIDKDHLNDLTPLLLRLLYGRLTTPTSKMDHYHRLVIVRFLAGCTVDQLDHFIYLLFHPFLKIFDINEADFSKIDEQITAETVKEQFNYKDIYT
ncbi:unnamed protein product, partial [Mesorhabditis belari]|uniref:U3 small nucleolar RNA-associated protein 20 N-terminal domain-containing protein n=1 Tax=Mesorhabditis belari TaxID=2138241 RepID=A0AAF3ENE1_9BILA